MSTTRKRFMKYALMFLGGGAVFQAGNNAGCVRFVGDTAVTATNFCFVFDCQNGILNGLIDPCSPVPIFDDCPNINP